MAGWISSITIKLNDRFSSGFKKVSESMNAAQGQIGKSVKELQNGNGMMQAARDMSVVSMYMGDFTQKFQDLAARPSDVASAFESGMARVSTVLTKQNAVGGDLAASMDDIQGAAERMAGGLNQAGKLAAIGTDVYANSVYTMLSSGLNVTQGIAATEQAALLAKATGGSMQDAASALTGIFNNLGDKSANAGVEMTRLSDIVAGTQNYFAFENLGQFTEGLKNASGAAVANKVPLTQLSAAIGQLNSNMITGAEAGTAVKSILAQMGNASSKLGFDIAKTSDGGIDLIKTFTNIKATGADGQAMMKAFGTEAGPAISLLTENLDDLKSGFDAVSDSSGITLSNAGKMADTLASKQENLNNAMLVWQGRLGEGNNAVKGVGLSMKLTAVQFANWITDIPVIGEGLAGLAGGSIQVMGGFAGVANAGLQASTGLLSFIGLVQKRKAIFGVLSGGLKLAGGGLKGMALSVIGAGKAVIGFIPTAISWIGTMWGVAAANLAVYWPIYAVVAAVAAVAAGAVLLYKNWDKVTAWFVGAWTKIKGMFVSGFHTIMGLFTNTPVWVQAAIAVFVPFIGIPMLLIGHWSKFKTFFAKLVDWIGGMAGKITAPFKWIGEKVGGLFGKDTGETVMTTMASGVMAGSGALHNAVNNNFNRVNRLIPHSDASEGPFSRLTQAGRAIGGTMAAGMGRDNSLKDIAKESFSNILQFPQNGRTTANPLSGLLRKLQTPGSKTGDTVIKIENLSLPDIKELPELMRFLESIKDELDREYKAG